ncbi:MAG: Cytosol aminopeptidase PepA [Rhodanobacteraceae bacterium]|jgi:leucyl aminopeptidase|nr:MAG: Cytosol aminopeptidase PepA [Rhodanobacteraceae bacterium]
MPVLEFSLGFTDAAAADTPCVVVGVYDGALSPAAAAIDAASGGTLTRLRESGDFTGKAGKTLMLHGLAGVKAPRVLLVGLGSQKDFDGRTFEQACADAGKALKGMPVASAGVWLPELEVKDRDANWRVRTCALVIDHTCFRYTATLKMPNGGASRLSKLELMVEAEAQRGLDEARALARGVAFARELGCLPPNLCTPTHIAAQAKTIADEHAGLVSLEVLEREDMQKLGMGALLAVSSGSATPPKLIVLQYNGAGDAKPYALVGKGVTFDTGGMNLKPTGSMEEMKYDMCGAAGVLGAFLSAVELKLPINLACVVPSVENMPDGGGYRPGDVLHTHAGITVEVLNTDAEGRLILCDALSYACKRFQPQALVDAATLTGACVIALGAHASGLFTADDNLADELLAAGNDTLDRAWRLPLWDDYRNQLESAFADIANIGGKNAGAVTAALFLSRFTEGTRWAHLDVAGTAWVPGRKGYATGRPVPLLTQWLIDRSV